MSDELDDTTAETTLPTRDVVDLLVANHRDFLAFVERRVGSRELAEVIGPAGMKPTDGPLSRAMGSKS